MRILSKRRGWTAARVALAASAGIATGCSPALAQDQESWRCSTDYGTYSQNALPIPRASHVLSGRILFHSGVVGEQWEPDAHIAFTDSRNPAPSGCFCNGIHAEIYSGQPDIVTFFMIYNGRSEGFAQAKVGIPITFRLSIDSQGIMTASVGKTNPISKSARLAHPQHDLAYMNCSSGDVSFLNLRAT
jgi:hypothetical protein